jgi:hypothetical protein
MKRERWLILLLVVALLGGGWYAWGAITAASDERLSVARYQVNSLLFALAEAKVPLDTHDPEEWRDPLFLTKLAAAWNKARWMTGPFQNYRNFSNSHSSPLINSARLDHFLFTANDIERFVANQREQALAGQPIDTERMIFLREAFAYANFPLQVQTDDDWANVGAAVDRFNEFWSGKPTR